MASTVPYHLRSSSGGQSDYEDKGIAGSFKTGINLDIRKQKDTLTCQQKLTDDLGLGTMTAPAYFIVPSSNGNTYFFCYDGKIWRRNSSGTYLLVYTDTAEAGHIIGACEWFSISGETILLWATATRLNLVVLASPGYTQPEPWNNVNTASAGTWPKTNLTSVTFHKMAIANGALQICNNNLIALVGYDLSYTNNALALIPGNTAWDITERGKYGVIACRASDNKDQTTFFSWDGIGLSWNDKQIVKFGGVNGIIDTEIALAQIGAEGQLYISDFTSQVPFRQIRGGGAMSVGSAASYHGMALLGIYGNTNTIQDLNCDGIYTVGRVNKNAPLALNLDYQLTCDAINSITTVNTDILVQYTLNNRYGVKKVDPDNKAIAYYASLDLVAPLGTRRYPIPLGRTLFWETIEILCQPLPSSCQIECWYKLDKIDTGGTNDDGWFQANLDPGNQASGTQFITGGKAHAMFFVGEKARTLEILLKLTPAGNETPEINEVNAYFSVG